MQAGKEFLRFCVFSLGHKKLTNSFRSISSRCEQSQARLACMRDTWVMKNHEKRCPVEKMTLLLEKEMEKRERLHPFFSVRFGVKGMRHGQLTASPRRRMQEEENENLLNALAQELASRNASSCGTWLGTWLGTFTLKTTEIDSAWVARLLRRRIYNTQHWKRGSGCRFSRSFCMIFSCHMLWKREATRRRSYRKEEKRRRVVTQELLCREVCLKDSSDLRSLLHLEWRNFTARLLKDSPSFFFLFSIHPHSPLLSPQTRWSWRRNWSSLCDSQSGMKDTTTTTIGSSMSSFVSQLSLVSFARMSSDPHVWLHYY